MAKVREIYKCEDCGTIVEVLHGGKGTLTCCDQPMKLFEEQTADMSKEKHVPVIEKTETGFKIKVGSTAHPMTEQHWIEWVQVIADGEVYRTFLNPGDEPEAEFMIEADKIIAREYCNIHGLWRNEL
ncbi:MAG: desulfoferrodoxin [Promethearchaeota archaeon]